LRKCRSHSSLQACAEDLSEFEEWKPLSHDLGPCEVKHGIEVSVANLQGDGIGNPALAAAFRLRKQQRRQFGQW